MKFYLDTEFEERGADFPIELISIALTCNKGEYYAQIDSARNWGIYVAIHYGFGRRFPTVDTPIRKVPTEDVAALYEVDPWLIDNVYRHLAYDSTQWQNRQQVKASLAEWLKDMQGTDKTMEFWGYFADYDWVLFSQIFGRMIDLQSVIKQLPMLCMDIKQEMKRLRVSRDELDFFMEDWLNNTDAHVYKGDTIGPHHCLYDARWNKEAHEVLERLERGDNELLRKRGLFLNRRS